MRRIAELFRIRAGTTGTTELCVFFPVLRAGVLTNDYRKTSLQKSLGPSANHGVSLERYKLRQTSSRSSEVPIVHTNTFTQL